MMPATVARIRRLSPQQKGILVQKVLEHRKTEPIQHWSPIVPLQPSPGKQPIYFVHPMGCALFFYLPLLSHFGPQYNLYGIRGHGLEEGQRALDSIPDMARCYIEAIRQHQPAGAIHLVGYSMGGLIAFEMAQQLQKEGKTVGLLALIDSYAFTKRIPFPGQEIKDADERLLMRLARTLDDGQRWQLKRMLKPMSSNRQRVEYVVQLAKENGKVPLSYSVEELQKMFDSYDAHLTAVEHYRPQPYAHPFLFLQCQDTSDTHSIPSIPWEKVASKGLLQKRLPGRHSTIMQEPQVQAVAHHLQLALQNFGIK